MRDSQRLGGQYCPPLPGLEGLKKHTHVFKVIFFLVDKPGGCPYAPSQFTHSHFFYSFLFLFYWKQKNQFNSLILKKEKRLFHCFVAYFNRLVKYVIINALPPAPHIPLGYVQQRFLRKLLWPESWFLPSHFSGNRICCQSLGEGGIWSTS